MKQQKRRYLCLCLLGLLGCMGQALMAQGPPFSVSVDLKELPTGARVLGNVIGELSKTADSLNMEVMTDMGTTWTVDIDPDQPWLKTLNAENDMPITGGTGPATVRIAYTENNDRNNPSGRGAFLIFEYGMEVPALQKRFVLMQREMVNPLRASLRETERPQPGDSDTELNDPKLITIDKRGGSRRGAFDVDVVSGGMWQITPSDPERGFDHWVSVGAGDAGAIYRGSGTEKVRVMCRGNVSTSARIAMLTLALSGDPAPPPTMLTIMQLAADPKFEIDVSSKSVPSRSGSFIIFMQATVPWMVSTDQPAWISVLDADDNGSLIGTTHQETQRIRIKHEANTSESSRMAMVTFSSTEHNNRPTLRISQAGRSTGDPPTGNVTGIHEDLARGLRLYPNPAEHRVSIAVDEEAHMRLRTRHGEVLGSYTLSPGEAFALGLDEYEEGLYFVEIQSASGRVVRRLVLR